MAAAMGDYSGDWDDIPPPEPTEFDMQRERARLRRLELDYRTRVAQMAHPILSGKATPEEQRAVGELLMRIAKGELPDEVFRAARKDKTKTFDELERQLRCMAKVKAKNMILTPSGVARLCKKELDLSTGQLCRIMRDNRDLFAHYVEIEYWFGD
jgi:hypothetical protein